MDPISVIFSNSTHREAITIEWREAQGSFVGWRNCQPDLKQYGSIGEVIDFLLEDGLFGEVNKQLSAG